jgi:hypothetical protein
MSDTISHTPSPPPFPSHKPQHPNQIPVIEHNCGNSNHVLLSIFSSFNSKSRPCIVAIQLPFLVNESPLHVPNYRLISTTVSSFYTVFTCFYVLPSIVESFSCVTFFLIEATFAPFPLNFLKNHLFITFLRCLFTTFLTIKTSTTLRLFRTL